MRCPSCGGTDDRVVDSREVELGAAIRRRRECASCGRRYTTFERLGEAVLLVAKRSGAEEPFDREKVVAGLLAACKNRPVSRSALEAVADDVEELVRSGGGAVASEALGVAVLEGLRELDQVAYLRFASVYKGFESAGDFEREAGLLTKTTAPKALLGAAWPPRSSIGEVQHIVPDATSEVACPAGPDLLRS